MNILFVSQLLYPEEISGIPIITWNQAKRLISLGCNVYCLTSTATVEQYYTTEYKDGIIIHYVPKYQLNIVSIKKIFNQIITSFRLRKFISNILAQVNFDVIHINDNFSLVSKIVMKLCAEQKNSYPVVREFWFFEDVCFRQNLIISELNKICSGPESINKCIQCYFSTYSSNNILKQSFKKITIPYLIKNQYSSFQKELNQYKALIFPDEGLKSFFLAIKQLQFSGNNFVIPHGIELKKNDTVIQYNGGSINFLFLGALNYRKGIDIVLDAFEKLLTNNIDNFKIYISGIISEKIYSEKITFLKLKYPNNIIYLGEYNPQQISEIIENNNIHCGIVPSYIETYSRVLREMLVNNLPVITTSFIGSSIIKDYENGIKIPVGNSNAFFEALKEIISKPDLIKNLSEGAFNTKIITCKDEGKLLLECYVTF